jgi:tetratricopeptide (TPR) repeat protein
VNLLKRATAVLPADDPARVELLPELAEALRDSARIEEAGEVIAEALRLLRGGGDPRVSLRVRLVEASHASMVGDRDMHWAAETAMAALQEAGSLGDPGLVTRAREAAGWFLFWLGRSREAEAVVEEGLAQARARGSTGDVMRLHQVLSAIAIWGPTPVEVAMERFRQVATQASGATEALALGVLGVVSAMRGDFEAARSHLERGEASLRDLGHELNLAAAHPKAMVGLLEGDYAAVEAITRKGIETLEAAGETGFLSTTAVFLAEALYGQGRYEEAVEASRLSEANTAAGDVASELGWRVARAKSLAHLGQLEEAERLAREALVIAEPTDHPQRADCFEALAIVLWLAGRHQDAAETAQSAVEILEAKGDIVSAARVKRLIGDIRS